MGYIVFMLVKQMVEMDGNPQKFEVLLLDAGAVF